MSTTFGITIGEKTVEIARRIGGGPSGLVIRFLDPLTKHLPDTTPVFPLDNSHQGVYELGDLRKLHSKMKKMEAVNATLKDLTERELIITIGLIREELVERTNNGDNGKDTFEVQFPCSDINPSF